MVGDSEQCGAGGRRLQRCSSTRTFDRAPSQLLLHLHLLHLQGVDVIHMKEWLEARGASLGGIAMRHFEATLKHTRPSAGDQSKLQAWQAEFGAE